MLPRTLAKAGKKPTIKTVETDAAKERWWYPVSPEKLNQDQKKRIQAGVVQQMVKIIFRTHFYEWEGTFYRQLKGGPIGLRATGFVARVLMDFWANQIKKMEEICQTLHQINPVLFENVIIHLLANMWMIV